MSKKICEKWLEDSVDYTGKLNNHEDYIKMLEVLENKCEFIGITSKHEIIEKFKKDIIKIETSHERWGIWTSYEETIHYIKASNSLFNYLKKYETFSKYISGKTRMICNIEVPGDYVELTDFGFNDIAFYDKEKNILLSTNTHEGFINITKEIEKEFITK